MKIDNDVEPLAGKPVVRMLRRRRGVTYARVANVILPLCFAQRMSGWHSPVLRRS
ncbi:MAG TPA: hypothetical protein VFG23_07090 [Polyangia bacterium]|nr:hypothetical protein [Polyangia bacterium]